MISTQEIPRDYTVPGTRENVKDVEGSRALRFIGRGEPFVESSISGPGGSGELALKIPENFRAYTLRPGNCCGTGDDVQPGDKVDVLATTGDPPRTVTLLSTRLVLTATRPQPVEDVERSSPEETSITLLVTPREAELLAQAEYQGEISISLCPMSGGR
jgi:Flp pilus assembly protein CpaB